MSATSLPEVGAKFGPWPIGPFDRAALARYAAVSQDGNPLHLDPALARRAGLADVPVHGMLLMGAIEPVLAAWRADLILRRLATKFVRPVLAGEPIAIAARVVRRSDGVSPSILMRIMANSANGQLALMGEATLVPQEG